MEGVLVSAKREGSTITITVVSDAQGRYSFPAKRLAPGRYALRVRAVGYELDSPEVVTVTNKGAVAELKLKKAADLAAQLSNGEWLASVPGTDRQKDLLLNCVGCHTLERIARSRYDADAFTKTVLPRMQGYVNQSIPQHPQLRKAERLMEERGDQRVQVYRTSAEYLSTLNLAESPKWGYELKTFPRPSGRATRVIYTEYDLPRATIETWEPFKNAPKGEPHNIYDVVPDSQNNAWFTDFRLKHIGRIDAKTGEVKLYEIPGDKPVVAPRRGQMDSQDRLWFAQYRGDRIAVLDTKTGEFKQWDIAPKWSAPYDVALDKNGEAWTGSMVSDQVTRVNTRTGEAVSYLLPRGTNIRRVHVDNSTTPVTFWVGSNHGASIIKLEPLD